MGAHHDIRAVLDGIVRHSPLRLVMGGAVLLAPVKGIDDRVAARLPERLQVVVHGRLAVQIHRFAAACEADAVAVHLHDRAVGVAAGTDARSFQRRTRALAPAAAEVDVVVVGDVHLFDPGCFENTGIGRVAAEGELLAARMTLGVALQHGFQVDQADVVIEKRLGNL